MQYRFVVIASSKLIRKLSQLGINCFGGCIDSTEDDDVYLRLKTGSSICLDGSIKPNWYGSEFENENLRVSIRKIIKEFCAELTAEGIEIDTVILPKSKEWKCGYVVSKSIIDGITIKLI